MIVDLHSKLNVNGFVIVDLLDDKDIVYLNTLCNQYLKTQNTDFISSSHILNKEDSDFINTELHKIVSEKFECLFPDLQLLGGTLATKVKGKSNLDAHQDWIIVDESKFNSYNLWIPLVATNSENGTLGLIVGSHKWQNNLRGFNLPNEYSKFTKQLMNIGYEPELKAGQAILYNHKIIHYSRPNQTEINRNVAIIGVKDKHAALQVSFSIDGKNIETYKVVESDFYKFDAERIKQTNEKISEVKINNVTKNWNNIESDFSQFLSNEFQYLFPTRKSSLSKLLNKLKF